jgi:hypothetical protein
MSCDTIPTPPPTEVDTGRVPRDTTTLVNTYLAVVALKSQVDAIALNLQGQVDGLGVDVAQSQAGEQRLGRALGALDAKLDLLLEGQRNLATGLLEANQRVVVLEQRQRRQSVLCDRNHEDGAAQ